MKRLLRRLVRSPRRAWNLAIDRLVIPLWLWLLDVKCGQGCKFAGMPLIYLKPGGHITLGNDVGVYSRLSANPRGIMFPTVLAVMLPDSHIEIGDHTRLTGVSIVSRDSIIIGQWVQIGPGACLWDNDGHPLDPDKRRIRPTTDFRCAPIRIEDDAFIGARAIIMKGVTIGKAAVVGTGAIVTKDVAPGDIVVGNPARVIGNVHKLNKTGEA